MSNGGVRHVIKIAPLRFPPVSHALWLSSRQGFLKCVSSAIYIGIIWIVCQKFQFPGYTPKNLIQCFWERAPQVGPLHTKLENLSCRQRRADNSFSLIQRGPTILKTKFFITHFGGKNLSHEMSWSYAWSLFITHSCEHSYAFLQKYECVWWEGAASTQPRMVWDVWNVHWIVFLKAKSFLNLETYGHKDVR